MVKNSGRIVPLLTILYIYTPIALFLFGWTKLWIACSCCIALAFSIRGMLKDFLSGNYAGDDDAIVMKTSAFAISTLFLLLVGYYAGWGRWVEQSSDWQKHNLILMDLTQGNWPVYYSTGDGHSMLSYYIAQYLLPALAGKCLHSVRLAEIANYVWAEIGLILVYLNLVRVTKARRTTAQFAAAFILVLFSPPVVLAKFVRWLADSGMDLAGVISGGPWFINEKAGLQMQYSGNFVLLRWVFPQAIVPWLTMLLFLGDRDRHVAAR